MIRATTSLGSAAPSGSPALERLLRARSMLASARDVSPSAADREAGMLVGERQIEEAVTDVIA